MKLITLALFTDLTTSLHDGIIFIAFFVGNTIFLSRLSTVRPIHSIPSPSLIMKDSKRKKNTDAAVQKDLKPKT
jgi:hypothetical protein